MPKPRTFTDCPFCHHHSYRGVPGYLCPVCKKNFCQKCMTKSLFRDPRCPNCTAAINPEKDALNM